MKKFLVILIILIAGIAYLGLSYHFILFDEKFTVLKKVNLSINNTYVDARGAKLFRIVAQPDLLKAGIKGALESDRGFSVKLPAFD